MIFTKKTLLILFICQVSIALAHVTLIYPSGGETFSADSNITIKWQEAINHGPSNWDLFFSADNGDHWQEIATNLSQSLSQFNWHLPNLSTAKGKIRVVQDNKMGTDYQSVSGAFNINSTTAIRGPSNSIQKSFKLSPAYPNPFNGSTIISFSLAKKSDVEINIYNVLGKKVEQLINNSLIAGNHKIAWNPENLSSGIYYYTIKNEFQYATGRLIYIK